MGCKIDECLASFHIQTSTGWVEHNQVYGCDLFQEAWQNILDRAFVETDVIKLVQVCDEVETSRGRTFYCCQLAGMGGEKASKKPDAAVEFEYFKTFLTIKQ